MNTLTSILGSFGRKSSSRTTASSTGPNLSQELVDKVIHVSLDLSDVRTIKKVFSKVIKIPGVYSVARDGDCQITVTGTMDPETLHNKLRTYRPMIQKVVLTKKHDSDEYDDREKSKKGKEKFVLDDEFLPREDEFLPKEDTYSEMLSPTSNWEPSEDDVDSGDEVAREMAQERECILVFSCYDNLDVDETSFIEAISKELHKREVTPLTYNLLGREKLDKEMLYRSRVGIMILSNCYVSSRQSLDHLVAVMEHWKKTDLVIIPIYFKVTLSDICGLKGRFEAAFLQLQRSLQEDRVQKWKAAVTEIVSIGGLEWTKGYIDFS